MKVAAFCKYGSAAASTRQRLLQYLPALGAAGIEVEARSLLDSDYIASLSSGLKYPRRRIAASYVRRFADLLLNARCDVMWVYSELFPYLPASFERLAFMRGIPVIYDMDDAFFHQYDDHPRLLVRRALAGKLKPLMRAATLSCCGNDYLERYAIEAGGATMLLPTVVDTDVYRPSLPRPTEVITLGWIGSPSTWRYMKPLLPLLEELCRERRVQVRAVGAGVGAEADRFPGLHLVKWSEDSEVPSIQAMDIGLMPLPDDRWERGKCGYKLIQYMACRLPVVASPIGVNKQIVRPGENGFLATPIEEWRASLITLIENEMTRRRFGEQGRRDVEAKYSLAVHAPRLVAAMQRVASGSGLS